MKLFNLKKTCDASPAQWIAINEQGEYVYIRYRFDALTAHCPFNPNDDEQDYQAFMSAQILNMNHVHDDEYRGTMETDEMLALTGYTLASFEDVLIGKTIKAIYPKKDDRWSVGSYSVTEESITCDSGRIILEFTDGTQVEVWNSEWGGISKPQPS